MWRIIFLILPCTAMADSLVAAHTIKAQTVLRAEDITVVADENPNSPSAASDAVGLEARLTIYAGRPILAAELGAPSVIDRNQIVSIGYQSGGLAILTEGRALARGGVGDVIRVMNLASRTTVMGRISPDGTVVVGPNF